MLRRVVKDLDKDKVTQEEFEHFSFTWRAVDTLVRDRLTMQPAAAPPGPSRKPPAEGNEG